MWGLGVVQEIDAAAMSISLCPIVTLKATSMMWFERQLQGLRPRGLSVHQGGRPHQLLSA